MFMRRHCLLFGLTVGALCAGCGPGGLFSTDAGANKVLAAKLGAADGSGVQAYVEFDDDDGHREFEVEISGGQPGATVEVSINGAVVVSVTLDEFGNAHLEFDSEPDEADEEPLPADFEDAEEGDEVEVGDMAGHFEEEDDDDEGEDDEGEDDVGDEVEGDDELDDSDDDADDVAGSDSSDASVATAPS